MCSFVVMFRYHLQDVVVGKIYFLLVTLKIIRMEVQLLKNEVISSGTRIPMFVFSSFYFVLHVSLGRM